MNRYSLLLILTMVTISSTAQDSLEVVPDTVPLKKDELGISILSPFIMLTGASDPVERYTNITYRHLFTRHHAIRAFTGLSLFNASGYEAAPVVPLASPGRTVVISTDVYRPTVFQCGIGYEYIAGHGMLRHGIGASAVYNNIFEVEKRRYNVLRDTTDGSGNKYVYAQQADTGATTRSFTYHKAGFNVHYTVRLEYSAHWMFTATFLVSYRQYRSRDGQDVSDLEMNGLISDMSIFYRF